MKENQPDADQAEADDGRTWRIAAARPLQDTSELKSLNRNQNYRGQQLQLNILPSTEWTSSDLCLLDSLVQDRNRFVCLQLVTMAREQHSKAAAAAAAAEAAALHAAQNTFLATASILPAAETAAVAVVAAGLFYPRLAGKDGQPLADPHVYLELMCCNRPGQGYGRLLLQHIEQFVADNCDALAAGWFRGGAGKNAAAAADPAAAGMTGRGATAAGSHARHDSSSGTSTASNEVEDDALIDVASDGCSTAGWSSSACRAVLTGSQEEAAVAAAAPGAAAPSGNALLPVLRPGPGSLSCSPTETSAAIIEAAAAAAAVPLAALSNAVARRIRGVKLLSVGGAQSFYTRLGYYQGPDGSSHEMFKALS